MLCRSLKLGLYERLKAEGLVEAKKLAEEAEINLDLLVLPNFIDKGVENMVDHLLNEGLVDAELKFATLFLGLRVTGVDSSAQFGNLLVTHFDGRCWDLALAPVSQVEALEEILVWVEENAFLLFDHHILWSLVRKFESEITEIGNVDGPLHIKVHLAPLDESSPNFCQLILRFV